MWGPFVMARRSTSGRCRCSSHRQRRAAVSGDQHAGNLLISDCIHAVAAVDPVFGRGHYPLIRIGKPASRYIARRS